MIHFALTCLIILLRTKMKSIVINITEKLINDIKKHKGKTSLTIKENNLQNF